MQNVAYYPINIVKGDTFNLVFSRKTKNCETGVTTPVDLSSVDSVEAKILDDSNTEVIEFTASVTDPANGQITLSLTATQTGTLSGTIADKPVEVIGRYYVRLITGSIKQTILRGKVSLTSVEGD